MYLNIGSDFSVRGETIVGVFDLDNTSCSKWTRKFLAEAQKAGADLVFLSGRGGIRTDARLSDKI